MTECSECGNEITKAGFRLDGGEVYCHECVEEEPTEPSASVEPAKTGWEE